MVHRQATTTTISTKGQHKRAFITYYNSIQSQFEPRKKNTFRKKHMHECKPYHSNSYGAFRAARTRAKQSHARQNRIEPKRI